MICNKCCLSATFFTRSSLWYFILKSLLFWIEIFRSYYKEPNHYYRILGIIFLPLSIVTFESTLSLLQQFINPSNVKWERNILSYVNSNFSWLHFCYLSACKGRYFNNLCIAVYEIKRFQCFIWTFVIYIFAFFSDSSELKAYRKNIKVCINRSKFFKTTAIINLSDTGSTTRKVWLHFVKRFLFLTFLAVSLFTFHEWNMW